MGRFSRRVLKVVERKAEHLYYDTVVASQAFSFTTPYQVDLTTVAQGSGESTRVGNSITAKSLNFRLLFVGGSDEYNTIRVILFRWHPDAAIYPPTFQDILEDSHAFAL